MTCDNDDIDTATNYIDDDAADDHGNEIAFFLEFRICDKAENTNIV